MLFAFALIFWVASPAPSYSSSSYDGLWFLGMNTNKDIFGDKNSRLVRQAVNYSIDRRYICKKIVGDNNVPSGVIPKGMDGYDGAIKGYPFDTAMAKQLLQKAGYTKNDSRLQELTLIHTNGTVTNKIAKIIQKQLGRTGFNVLLRQVNYEVQGEWENYLASGKYHLFLMGYKPFVPGSESTKETTSVALLNDLFGSGGEANFFALSDKKVDLMLSRAALEASQTNETTSSLRRLNALLQDDPITVNLFYIKKM